MQTSYGGGGNGCTVGVVRVPQGILFFKNRDLRGEHFANHVTTFQPTAGTYALRGVNLETGEPDGVSIGVNQRGICVANSHVVSSSDVTYDVLCERLVLGVHRKGDVPRIVQDFMAGHIVQGGRILVASAQWAFLIEVFRDLFEIAEVEGSFVITNHFSLLPHRVQRSEERKQSSRTRLQVATRRMQSISDVEALKSMLRSHTPAKGELSICNHRQDGGGTESSHIIEIQGDDVGWSYLTGYPCENDYRTVRLFASNGQS